MFRSLTVFALALVLALAGSSFAQDKGGDKKGEKGDAKSKHGIHMTSFTVISNGTRDSFRIVVQNTGTVATPKGMSLSVVADFKILIEDRKVPVHKQLVPVLEPGKTHVIQFSITNDKLPKFEGRLPTEFIATLDIPILIEHVKISRTAKVTNVK